MSTDAVVDRLALHWRPDGPGLVDADRMDRVGRALATDALEAAFAEVDDPDELLCIRRLVVDPVRVDAGLADHQLVACIRDALAGSLRQLVAAGGDDVVRYRSRADARADALVALAAGDRRRAWAWRQLDLWPLGDGPVEPDAAMVEVLGRDGAVAAVVAALEPPALDALVAVLGPDRLAGLVRQAWPGGGDDAVDWAALLIDATPSPDEVDGAVATLRASSLGRRLLAGPAWPGSSLAALAVLAVLAHEPALVQVPPRRARSRLAAAVVVVLAHASRADVGAAAGAGPHADPSAPSDAVVARHDRDLETGAGPGSGDRAAPGQLETSAPVPTGPRPASDPPEAVDVDGSAIGAGPRPVGARDRRFVTEWAGLLFLSPLVERTGLVARVDASPWGAVGGRHVLHAVGLALMRRLGPVSDGPRPNDPAVLAWCGLAPGLDPPAPNPGWDPDRPDASGAGLAALVEGEAERIVAALRQAVDPDPRARAETPDLLASICRRRAIVVADPGWIDVVMDVDQVSTVVRRAGLDLDPGYRPWLGVVVRFRYV